MAQSYIPRKNAESGATVKGINLEFKMKPLRDFSLSAGFTLQKSLYDTEQQFNEKRFFRTPSDYGFFVADWISLRTFVSPLPLAIQVKCLFPISAPTQTRIRRTQESDPFYDLGLKISHTISLMEHLCSGLPE